jgi:hypothetical protein|tara:strand:- start:358 stop:681 length:324 start_codon:yes stop_codon:yes gene_type:complete
MEQIDWTTKDVVIPSKLKVGDIISYILFNEGDNGYEHTRQLLVEYREREVIWGTMHAVTKYEFVCILLKTDSDNKNPGETSTFELQRNKRGVRDYTASYWRIYERAK